MSLLSFITMWAYILYHHSPRPPVDIIFIADKNYDFDFFIFSQQWPLSRCISFTEMETGHHKCMTSIFNERRWTIHGIWPTRVGSKSPAFCNKRKSFDIQRLEPIIDKLNENWVNVANDSSSTLFWQHEWVKHGTCCAETDLESEQNYFRQGLTWSQQFSMSQILEDANVIPGGTYKVVHMHNVIYKTLSHIPSIHCISTKDGNNYLSEIRLCFSKSLELIDCRVTGNSEVEYRSIATEVELITNCNLHSEIIYPDTFPQTYFGTSSQSNNSWLQTNLHKVVEFFKLSLL